MGQQPVWFQEGLGGSSPEVYERSLVPAIFGPWAEDLVALAALRPGERVLDVACGTGVVARLAAGRVGGVGKVVGLDLNAGMLNVARALPPPPGASIEWREGNALAMPFADGSFDAVLCQQGVQFFPDRAAGLREMRRVLIPGGRLVLSTWRSIHHSPGFAALAEALARPVGPNLLDGPFSLSDGEELRALLTGAGFTDVSIRPSVKAIRFPSVEVFVWHYLAATPLAGRIAEIDDSTRSALIGEVTAALQTYLGAEGLAFPIESHLTVARA
jgi:ubiquinone/menaquinone biosynthesis C-methylase UbiE